MNKAAFSVDVVMHPHITLSWPAKEHWYYFVGRLHESLARRLGHGYSDKDIMLVGMLDWENGERGYQHLKGFVATIVRFNERSNDHGDRERVRKGRDHGISYQITLNYAYDGVCGFKATRIDD